MADEGYYEDDYYDDYYGTYDEGGEPAEETWESKIEIKFDDAKSLLEYNTPECTRLMKEILTEDEAKGIWSFKAYMTLASASRLSRQYDEMIQFYEQAVAIAGNGVDLALAEPPVQQFISDVDGIPTSSLRQVIETTLKIAQDHAEMWKVHCTALLKRAASCLSIGDSASAMADLRSVENLCDTDTTQSEDQHAVQLYHMYALQLWAYRLKRQYGTLRLVYYTAIRMQPPFVPLTLVGDVHQEGGHMLLRDGDWYAAQKAFTSAFRAYTGVGDARRVPALKYATLANMLGGPAIETLSSAENKLLSEDAALKAVAQLEAAVVARDVREALRVLGDTQNAEVLVQDTLFAPYVDQLLYRLRLDAVRDYVQGFTSLRLEHLAERLAWDVANTADLCTVAIYHGLNATVDVVANVLYLYDSTSTSELIRANELRVWATTATLS